MNIDLQLRSHAYRLKKNEKMQKDIINGTYKEYTISKKQSLLKVKLGIFDTKSS